MEGLHALYHGHLDEEARQELHRRAHLPNLAARTRDRLEMLRLSDAGGSIPRIAKPLKCHEQTVRRWIKGFLREGFDALVDPPRPGKPSAITEDILLSVRPWINQADRIGRAGQIAQEVAQVSCIHRSVDP